MIEATMPCAFCAAIAVNRCSTRGCTAPVCADHGRVVGAAHINTGPDSRGHYFMQIIECERCRVERERIEQSGAYREGQSLRKMRVDRGISLRRAADTLAVSPTVLSRIERGLDVMTDEMRQRARVMLGMASPEIVIPIDRRGA